MQDTYRQLKEILADQADLINELIELGRAETTALRAGDLDALTGLVSRQNEGVTRLQALNARRRAIQDALQACLAPEGESLGWEEVLAAADTSREELAILQEYLRTGSRVLQELNETNRLLIRQSLSFVDAVLRSWGAPQTVYDREGRVEQPLPGLVDRTV